MNQNMILNIDILLALDVSFSGYMTFLGNMTMSSYVPFSRNVSDTHTLIHIPALSKDDTTTSFTPILTNRSITVLTFNKDTHVPESISRRTILSQIMLQSITL